MLEPHMALTCLQAPCPPGFQTMGIDMLNCRKFKLLFTALILATAVVSKPAPVAAEHASFKDEVYPILKSYCQGCHQPGGPGYENSGLDMSNYDTLMKGTRHGSVVIPGDAFSSNLMVLIEGRADKSLKMPHDDQLSPTGKDRQLIRAWIADGANDDDVFRDAVLPVLERNCLACHQPGGKGYNKSGLDMRTYESLMKGTSFGPVVVPGDSFASNLMVLMEGRADASLTMPHAARRKLSRWQKHLIRTWINRGAKNN